MDREWNTQKLQRSHIGKYGECPTAVAIMASPLCVGGNSGDAPTFGPEIRGCQRGLTENTMAFDLRQYCKMGTTDFSVRISDLTLDLKYEGVPPEGRWQLLSTLLTPAGMSPQIHSLVDKAESWRGFAGRSLVKVGTTTIGSCECWYNRTYCRGP